LYDKAVEFVQKLGNKPPPIVQIDPALLHEGNKLCYPKLILFIGYEKHVPHARGVMTAYNREMLQLTQIERTEEETQEEVRKIQNKYR
jgi:hypothetical protein